MLANWENSVVATGSVDTGSVFIPIPKKGNAKECSNCRTIALISHASKGILKILQSRLQQYMNQELPDIQVGFRKGRGTRDQIAIVCWIIEKARELQKKTYTTVSLTVLKSLTVWITANWKILQEMEKRERSCTIIMAIRIHPGKTVSREEDDGLERKYNDKHVFILTL